MKITLVTPLYPPEISEPAPYVKELAKRLHAAGHTIIVVTYGHLPEKIPGIKIIPVNKHRPLLIRLIAFTKTLWSISRSTDIIYTENGASVELPATIVAFMTHKPLIMHVGDKDAGRRSDQRAILKYIKSFALSRAQSIITEIPLRSPEVLPFTPTPTKEQGAYNASWEKHIEMLIKKFDHA